MRINRIAAIIAVAVCFFPSLWAQSESTYAGDRLRTGLYPDQPILSPSTVSSSTFGKIFDTSVVGQVYAQPLVSGQILLVATEQNWIYGLDALTGKMIWSRDLGGAWNVSDVGCGDLTPTIGISSTPVIDNSTQTAYFVRKAYVSGHSGLAAYWMHAVDVNTGTEKANFPVVIQGTAQNDDASSFEATSLMNRASLLLMDGVVYAGFGAMCDIKPYKGWIAGVSTAGRLTALWTAAPGPHDGAGIWQSGGGLVSDGPGRIFFATGNGYHSTPNGSFDASKPPPGLAQSIVRLSVQNDGSLEADNFFSPYDAEALDDWDADLGSGAPAGLPEGAFGNSIVPRLLVVCGKQGYVYLLNRDNLGGQKMGVGGSDAVVSRIGPYGGVWSRPAVWPGDGGHIFIVTGSTFATAGPVSGMLREYKYGVDGTGTPTLSLESSSAEQFGGY